MASAPARSGLWRACVCSFSFDDQVVVEPGRHLLADPPQAAQELLVAVPGLTLDEHCADGYVLYGKQGGGDVADVVVDDIQGRAQTHGQQRLGVVQSLQMRFLVNAEHGCPVGRVEVEPDDVAHHLNKVGIPGELVAVRLPRDGVQVRHWRAAWRNAVSYGRSARAN